MFLGPPPLPTSLPNTAFWRSLPVWRRAGSALENEWAGPRAGLENWPLWRTSVPALVRASAALAQASFSSSCAVIMRRDVDRVSQLASTSPENVSQGAPVPARCKEADENFVAARRDGHDGDAAFVTGLSPVGRWSGRWRRWSVLNGAADDARWGPRVPNAVGQARNQLLTARTPGQARERGPTVETSARSAPSHPLFVAAAQREKKGGALGHPISGHDGNEPCCAAVRQDRVPRSSVSFSASPCYSSVSRARLFLSLLSTATLATLPRR